MQQTELDLNLNKKRTRKRECLGQMEHVVRCTDLVALTAPCAPEGKKRWLPFAVQLWAAFLEDHPDSRRWIPRPKGLFARDPTSADEAVLG